MHYVIDLPQCSSYEPPSKRMKYSSGMCVCSLCTCMYLMYECFRICLHYVSFGILKVVYMFVILFFAVIICLCVELHMSYFCLNCFCTKFMPCNSWHVFGLLKISFENVYIYTYIRTYIRMYVHLCVLICLRVAFMCLLKQK